MVHVQLVTAADFPAWLKGKLDAIEALKGRLPQRPNRQRPLWDRESPRRFRGPLGGPGGLGGRREATGEPPQGRQGGAAGPPHISI